jgi:hypothetical protein
MTKKPRPAWPRNEMSDRDKMSLPKGETCGACIHFAMCQGFCGHIAEDEVCDWSPSRFRTAPIAAEIFAI